MHRKARDKRYHSKYNQCRKRFVDTKRHNLSAVQSIVLGKQRLTCRTNDIHGIQKKRYHTSTCPLDHPQSAYVFPSNDSLRNNVAVSSRTPFTPFDQSNVDAPNSWAQ